MYAVLIWDHRIVDWDVLENGRERAQEGREYGERRGKGERSEKKWNKNKKRRQ